MFTWWRGKPEVVEVNGQPVIRLSGEVHHYSLNGDQDEIRRLSELLLRVRQSDDDALEFVKSYGLLGLWQVERYRLYGASEKGTVRLAQGQECSRWFLQGDYRPGHEDYYTQWQEPLFLFLQAVNDMHFTAQQMEEGNPGLLHEFLKDCHPRAVYFKGKWEMSWHVPSLLHACYLGLCLSITKGYMIRMCEYRYCGRLFYTTRKERRYCSPWCQNNERRLRHYHKHKQNSSS